MSFKLKKRKNKQETAEPQENAPDIDKMAPEEREAYIYRKLNEVAIMLERINLSEYMRYINQPWRVIRKNFVAGISKGFGTAIGFVLLSAIIITILQRIAAANWPWISDLLAEIIKSVQVKMS